MASDTLKSTKIRREGEFVVEEKRIVMPICRKVRGKVECIDDGFEMIVRVKRRNEGD